MRRVTIRELDSQQKVKPRVADVIFDDNDQILLEVKQGNEKRQVELCSIIYQVVQALQKSK